MKQLLENPKPPFQLFRPSKEDPERMEPAVTHYGGKQIWACGECGTLQIDTAGEQRAADCCRKFFCTCGEERPSYWEKCSRCQSVDGDAKRLEKAVEVKDYEGPVFCQMHDKFFSDIGEFEDWAADQEPDNLPEFVFACTSRKFERLDASDVVQHELEQHHEDAEVDDLDELKLFLNQWCDKQNVTSYDADYTRKIRVTQITESQGEERC